MNLDAGPFEGSSEADAEAEAEVEIETESTLPHATSPDERAGIEADGPTATTDGSPGDGPARFERNQATEEPTRASADDETGPSTSEEAQPEAPAGDPLTRASRLADRLEASDPHAAQQLRSLASVAFTADAAPDDALAWSGVDPFQAFDVGALAAAATRETAPMLGVASWSAEFARNLLVFVPVLVTWVALGVASRVYATCEMIRRGEEIPSFLFLWQQGFRTTNALRCDLAVVDGPIRGFASFNEVVFVDALALGAIIALTAVAHAAGSAQTAKRTAAAAGFAAELKSVLVDAAKKLYRIRATHEEDATGRMVVSALGDLRNVAAEFSATASRMLTTLEERARTAQSHLDHVSRVYEKIARDAESTSAKLAGVLDRAAGTAHELATSVERASAEFTGLGTKIEGASNALSTRLDTADEHLMSVDAAVRRLVALDEKSQDTRREILDHAKLTTGITPLIQGVVNVEERIRKLGGEIRYLAERDVMALPRAGWQFGIGAIAVLALFQLLTLLAVVGDPAANAGQTQPSTATRVPARTVEPTPDLFIPVVPPEETVAPYRPNGPQ